MGVLSRVAPGDLPRAADHNQIVTVINALDNITGDGGIEVIMTAGGLSISGPNVGSFNLPVLTTVGVNDTGTELNRLEIAGIDQDQMDEVDAAIVDRVPAVVLRTTEDGDVGNWVIALEKIPPGSSGTVAIAGVSMVSMVRSEDNSDLSLRHAEFNKGEPNLIASPIGTARILWENSSDELALVSFGYASPPLFAEATSDPSDGTLTVKLATSDGTLIGEDITVYDGGIA